MWKKQMEAGHVTVVNKYRAERSQPFQKGDKQFADVLVHLAVIVTVNTDPIMHSLHQALKLNTSFCCKSPFCPFAN